MQGIRHYKDKSNFMNSYNSVTSVKTISKARKERIILRIDLILGFTDEVIKTTQSTKEFLFIPHNYP